MKYFLGAFFSFLFIITTMPVLAGSTPNPEIFYLNTDGLLRTTINPFPKNYHAGLSLAAGDLGEDRVAEIVTGSGLGEKPEVKILREDGSLITSFLAYDETFGRGINVAVGDVDGDGLAEIVTGTRYGGGAHIRIFDGFGQPKFAGFFAYDKNFRGGVYVTVKDLDRDGRAEIITGAGPSGGPHIKIFDSQGTLKSEFFAFDATDSSGVTVGTADINGDGQTEILTARASSDPPEIKFFSPQGLELGKLLPYEATFIGGITAQGFDIDRDGRDEILVTPNGKTAPVKIFKSDGSLIKSFYPFAKNFDGAVELIPTFLRDASLAFITGSSRSIRDGSIELPKSIRVDLSEQRVFAYAHGLLAHTALVSTGVAKYPTPPGNYTVQRKIPIKDYVHSYGASHPDNYALYNVKWNLQFRTGYYLHYAYWHHNFGHRMSHGCVNLDYDTAEWLYNWSEAGLPVTIEN